MCLGSKDVDYTDTDVLPPLIPVACDLNGLLIFCEHYLARHLSPFLSLSLCISLCLSHLLIALATLSFSLQDIEKDLCQEAEAHEVLLGGRETQSNTSGTHFSM